jgi:hypothetical protein
MGPSTQFTAGALVLGWHVLSYFGFSLELFSGLPFGARFLSDPPQKKKECLAGMVGGGMGTCVGLQGLWVGQATSHPFGG